MKRSKRVKFLLADKQKQLSLGIIESRSLNKIEAMEKVEIVRINLKKCNLRNNSIEKVPLLIFQTLTRDL